MSDGVQLMSSITNDLLDIERLRMGALQLTLGPVSVAQLLQSCADAVRAAQWRRDVPCHAGFPRAPARRLPRRAAHRFGLFSARCQLMW